jgi:Uma2 family endonuclease
MAMAQDLDGDACVSFDELEKFIAGRPEGERWELFEGRAVRTFLGESWEHNAIVRNISAALTNEFRGGERFMTFTETFYFKSRALDSALLPDVMVISGKPPAGATSVDDPLAIFEVVTRETEARDRFDKWHIYQQLPSLQHYALASRDRPYVEVMDRVDGQWSGLRVFDGVAASIGLPAIGAELTLDHIYSRVLG